MKMFPDTSVVYLHKAPVDFRKGINSLSFIVEQNMNLNPFSEVLFVSRILVASATPVNYATKQSSS